MSHQDQSSNTAQQANMKNMMHAHPMPNYMAIMKKEAGTIKLNDHPQPDESTRGQEHHTKATELAADIVAAEHTLAEASMDGTNLENMMKKFDEIAVMRRTLAELKTKCRDLLQTILTSEQWTQLVTLQKSAMGLNQQANMKNMMHAHPMPNYMAIMKKEAGTIKLNDQQKERKKKKKKRRGAEEGKSRKTAGERIIKNARKQGEAGKNIM
ncbi:hypothetical protein [Methylotuvimicrobium alcaliphilum]|uniref:hypothetical protein n=1 Tax=Methylotuvimicrobium alcaliphilum TaxID=271065 RepID=UPI0006981EA6|nr:hypothetical protein [Methylotuvimicrobium alcaliphilum]